MSGHKSFKILRDEIDADPVRRAHMEELGRAYDALIALVALRQGRSRKRKRLDGRLDGAHADVSQLDQKADMRLSTLARHVETLGGHLAITAVFPDQRIRLGVPTGEAPACDEGTAPLEAQELAGD